MNKICYRPIVTVEEAVNFDPTKPETATPSRAVNILIAALQQVHGANQRSLAEHIGVSPRAIAGAVEFDTGMNFEKFLDEWRAGMIRRHIQAHDRLKGDDGAHLLGFYNRTSLWLFIKRMGLKKVRY